MMSARSMLLGTAAPPERSEPKGELILDLLLVSFLAASYAQTHPSDGMAHGDTARAADIVARFTEAAAAPRDALNLAWPRLAVRYPRRRSRRRPHRVPRSGA